MARNKKGRVRSTVSSRRLPLDNNYVTRPTDWHRLYTPIQQDRRFYHPDPITRGVTRRTHSLTIASNTPPPRTTTHRHPPSLPHRVQFATPGRVGICERRRRRREVIMAKGHGGRRGQRRPIFNEYSQISCGSRRKRR